MLLTNSPTIDQKIVGKAVDKPLIVRYWSMCYRSENRLPFRSLIFFSSFSTEQLQQQQKH